ncbi:MAG: hypothetical protein IKS67_00530 [Victivallales bacterium]|nr:hypothetical protein [Victivallales bacterium]
MDEQTMDMDELVAMAVAAVAEDLRQDVKRIRVVSFREVFPSPLENYLAERKISFKRYELKDELA